MIHNTWHERWAAKLEKEGGMEMKSQISFGIDFGMSQTRIARVDCYNIESLQQYLLGDLAAIEQQFVRSHIERCYRCNALIQTLQLSKNPFVLDEWAATQTWPHSIQKHEARKAIETLLLSDEEEGVEETLYRETMDILDLLQNQEIKGKDMTSLRNTLFQKVLQLLAVINGSEETVAALYLCDEEEVSLHPVASTNTNPDSANIPHYGITSKALHIQLSSRDVDGSEDDDRISCSELAIPLFNGKKVIGVISLRDPDPYCFSQLGVTNGETILKMLMPQIIVQLMLKQEALTHHRSERTAFCNRIFHAIIIGYTGMGKRQPLPKDRARISYPLHLVPEEEIDKSSPVEPIILDDEHDRQVVSLKNKLMRMGYLPQHIHVLELTEEAPNAFRKIVKELTNEDSLLVYFESHDYDKHEKDPHILTASIVHSLRGKDLPTERDHRRSNFLKCRYPAYRWEALWEECFLLLKEAKAKDQFIIIDAMQSASLSILQTSKISSTIGQEVTLASRSNDHISEELYPKWQTIHILDESSDGFSPRCLNLIEDAIYNYISVKEDLPALDFTTAWQVMQDLIATKPHYRSLKFLDGVNNGNEGSIVLGETVPCMKPNSTRRIFLSYAREDRNRGLQILSSLGNQCRVIDVGTTFSQISLLPISSVTNWNDTRDHKYVTGIIANSIDSLRDNIVSLDALVIVGSHNLVNHPTVFDEIDLAQTHQVSVFCIWIEQASMNRLTDKLPMVNHIDASGDKFNTEINNLWRILFSLPSLPRTKHVPVPQVIVNHGKNDDLFSSCSESQSRSLARLGSLGFDFLGDKSVILPPTVQVPRAKIAINTDERGYCTEVSLGEFRIGSYPVTVAEYALYCAAHPKPPHWLEQQQKLDHPIVNITWEEALAYVSWLSQQTGQYWRLPTEVEWEFAACGTDRRMYPWGNKWDSSRANTLESKLETTTPVGIYADTMDTSPYGLHDMAGNVWEWTSSLWQSTASRIRSDSEKSKENIPVRVLRGGSWMTGFHYATVKTRVKSITSDFSSDRGFRVVLESAPSP